MCDHTIEVIEREPLVEKFDTAGHDFCSAPGCKRADAVAVQWTHASSCYQCGGMVSLCDEHYAQLRSELRAIVNEGAST